MFVTGCHRSGTSLVASLLGDLVGQQSEATPQLSPKPDNPQGFFESRQLVALNNELLSWLGRDWSTPPLLAPCWDQPPLLSRLEGRRNQLKHWALKRDWVDKDPRLCITYSAYLHLLLKRVPIFGVLRHPLEVATSLYARNGMPLNLGLCLWFLYNHHLSAVFESSDCLLTYDSVLAAQNSEDSFFLLSLLAPLLDSAGIQLPSDKQWQEVLNNRLRPDLNRSQASLPYAVRLSINPVLQRSCERAYSSVSVKGSCSAESFYDSFESVPRELLFLLAREGRLFDSGESLKILKEEQFPLLPESQVSQTEYLPTISQSGSVEKALKQAQSDLSALKSSRSWQITAPLRALMNCLRGSE